MSAATISALISGAGFVVSIMASAFIAGFRWGQVRADLRIMQHAIDQSVTKDELASVRESVAEIKGMFRLTLKDGPG